MVHHVTLSALNLDRLRHRLINYNFSFRSLLFRFLHFFTFCYFFWFWFLFFWAALVDTWPQLLHVYLDLLFLRRSLLFKPSSEREKFFTIYTFQRFFWLNRCVKIVDLLLVFNRFFYTCLFSRKRVSKVIFWWLLEHVFRFLAFVQDSYDFNFVALNGFLATGNAILVFVQRCIYIEFFFSQDLTIVRTVEGSNGCPELWIGRFIYRLLIFDVSRVLYENFNFFIWLRVCFGDIVLELAIIYVFVDFHSDRLVTHHNRSSGTMVKMAWWNLPLSRQYLTILILGS